MLIEVLQVVDIHIAVQIHVAGRFIAAGRRCILRQAFIDGRHVPHVGCTLVVGQLAPAAVETHAQRFDQIRRIGIVIFPGKLIFAPTFL